MKGNKVFGIVWIFLAVILSGILISSMFGGKKFMFKWISGKSSSKEIGNRPENAEMHYSLNDISTIDVDVDILSICVERKDVDDIRVFFDMDEKYWPSVNVVSTGKVLKITRDEKINFLFNIFDSDMKIYIDVPMSFEPDDLDFKSESGSIKITGIKCKTLDCKSTSGSVHLYGCEVKDADLKSTSGSVKAEDSSIEKLDGNSMSGSVNIEGKFGKLDLKSTSGSVKVDSKSPLTDDSKLESVSGSVRLNVPDESGLKIKYSTVSGGYKNLKSGTSGKSSGTDLIGDGKVSLSLKTVSGSIKIE